ncbi:hypothetical protein HZA86_03785 [Candidatus Uhrbacteria bacterium]|nr:hypothetical protein [Candidatus Uhrbacteria bacterium]
MPRTMEEKLKERLEEIRNLMREKERIDTRLAELTGLLKNDQRKKVPPQGFVLMDEIKKVYQQSAIKKLKITEVVPAVEKGSGFLPDRKIVQSTMQYLVKKGFLKKSPERGYFEASQ